MRKYPIFFPALPLVCLLASCAAPPPPPPPSDYNAVATIKDIMDSVIDPSADYIWNSMGTEADADGIREKRPQTEEEWKEVRRHAVVLVEAANLLLMPGRQVARPGERSEYPEVELNPEDIEALITKDPATYIKLTKEFQVTAIAQLKAMDERNVPELLRIGGDLDNRCEGCHKIYWYPNDPVYKQPAPGFSAPTTAPAGNGAETK